MLVLLGFSPTLESEIHETWLHLASWNVIDDDFVSFTWTFSSVQIVLSVPTVQESLTSYLRRMLNLLRIVLLNLWRILRQTDSTYTVRRSQGFVGVRTSWENENNRTWLELRVLRNSDSISFGGKKHHLAKAHSSCACPKLLYTLHLKGSLDIEWRVF